MLIDFHTPIFPDALTAKTLPRLSHIAYDSPYYTDGTERGALDAMSAWGVDRAVVLHIATKPGQQKTVNRFAAEVQARNPNMLCFGTVHPKDPGAADEIAEIKAAGLCGVKLHPAYQACYFGDEAYFPIYAAIEKAGLPLLLHLSLIHISEPTRLGMISYAVFCLKKKKKDATRKPILRRTS